MNESPVKDFWERLNNLVLVRFLLLFACGWALILVLDYFQAVIIIFTFAAIVAFLLSYPVTWLCRFLPYGVAASLVFLFSLVVIAGIALTLGLTVTSQAQQLADSITKFFNSIEPAIRQLEQFLNERDFNINLRAIEEPLREQALTGIVSSLAIFQTFFTNFVYILLITVVSFFMLLDGKRLWDLLLKFVPVEMRSRFSIIIKRKFLGFFRAQLILALFLFSASFVAFLILQVPFALLLAVIAGLFDLIPGIGSTLGVLTVFLIALFQNVWLVPKVLIASVVIQQVQDQLLVPRIMQNSLNLNPVVVFFALLTGARVAGLLGIIISIPIAGVVVSLFEIDEMKGET